MNVHEQSIQAGAAVVEKILAQRHLNNGGDDYETLATEIARSVLAAANPVIRSLAELEGLPEGSAVRTSDTGDTVVLKDQRSFTNSCGADIDAETLWNYGDHPFHLIYRAA